MCESSVVTRSLVFSNQVIFIRKKIFVNPAGAAASVCLPKPGVHGSSLHVGLHTACMQENAGMCATE